MSHAVKTYALFCLFIVSFLYAGFSYGQTERFLNIEEHQSPAGISYWLVREDTLPIIAIAFSFQDAGAKNDPPDKQGLSIIAASTMNESAGPYENEEFLNLQNDNNISLSFSATRDHFGGALRMLTQYQALGFDLLYYAINEPRFDEKPLERMINANLTRIRSSLSDPSWINARIMNDIAFEGHPYALNSGGTLSSLPTITPSDLHNFVKERFDKNRLKISVTGEITSEEAGEQIDRIFGNLPQNAALNDIENTEIQNGGNIYLYKRDIPQTHIAIAQPFVGRNHPDYYTAIVANYILGGGGFGSRLTEEIREKRGLTYGIYSSMTDMSHLQSLNVGTSTNNEAVAEMISLIKAEFEKMRQEEVSAEELADAKSYLIGSMPLSLSSTSAISSLMQGLQLDNLPSTYLDSRAAKINAVSADDIRSFSKEYLMPDNFTIIMTGMPENIEGIQTIETLPNVE